MSDLVLNNKWYRIVETLFENKSPTTYRATYKVQEVNTLKRYLLKLIDLSKSVENNVLEYKIKQCKTETDALKQLNHPNIVQFIDCIENPKNVFHIIMEYCEYGDLHKHIQERKNNIRIPFHELHIVTILEQIAKALQYAQTRYRGLTYIHRDIKPHNIVISYKDQYNITVKLCDFGSAKILDRGEEYMQTKVGTERYMAPELYRGEEYNPMADIWSFGALGYELATLKLLYNIPSDESERARLRNGEIKPIIPDYSQYFKLLIYSMLDKNPYSRNTLPKLIRHFQYLMPELEKGTPKKELLNKEMYDKNCRIFNEEELAPPLFKANSEHQRRDPVEEIKAEPVRRYNSDNLNFMAPSQLGRQHFEAIEQIYLRCGCQGTQEYFREYLLSKNKKIYSYCCFGPNRQNCTLPFCQNNHQVQLSDLVQIFGKAQMGNYQNEWNVFLPNTQQICTFCLSPLNSQNSFLKLECSHNICHKCNNYNLSQITQLSMENNEREIPVSEECCPFCNRETCKYCGAANKLMIHKFSYCDHGKKCCKKCVKFGSSLEQREERSLKLDILCPECNTYQFKSPLSPFYCAHLLAFLEPWEFNQNYFRFIKNISQIYTKKCQGCAGQCIKIDDRSPNLSQFFCTWCACSHWDY